MNLFRWSLAEGVEMLENGELDLMNNVSKNIVLGSRHLVFPITPQEPTTVVF